MKNGNNGDRSDQDKRSIMIVQTSESLGHKARVTQRGQVGTEKINILKKINQMEKAQYRSRVER